MVCNRIDQRFAVQLRVVFRVGMWHTARACAQLGHVHWLNRKAVRDACSLCRFGCLHKWMVRDAIEADMDACSVQYWHFSEPSEGSLGLYLDCSVAQDGRFFEIGHDACQKYDGI